MQSLQQNSVVGVPQAYLVCPNDQYAPAKTCEDFGDSLALSDNGRIMILTGGFKQPQVGGMKTMQDSLYRSYVYQTAGCVSDKNTPGA